MKTTPGLQAIITRLAEKYGVNLDKAGAYLRLELPGHGQLVVENIGAGRISIANYVQIRADWILDPGIVVYVDSNCLDGELAEAQSCWLPMEITDLFGGWRLYAELDGSGNLVLYDLAGQIELAAVAERVVARNLLAHGWLERSTQSNLPRPERTWEEILARDICDDDVPF